MKKIIFVLLFCTTPFFGQYTLIPDPVFEQNLVYQQIDSDGTVNGYVLTSDIATRTQLGLGSTNGGLNSVTNLQGIEGFSALQILYISGNDSLYNANVTNMSLKELHFDGNLSLTNVYVSAPLLETLNITSVVPFVHTLDVTNCPMLSNLYCPNNALQTLDVSNKPKLEFLNVRNNNLTQLITGNNPKLLRAVCWNNHLTSLDVTSSPLLTHLYAGTNNLTNLNVSQNPLLQVLSCELNNLSSIDVSQNSFLQSISSYSNNITSFNLQNNPQLKVLWCQENNLTELNLQNGSNNLLNGTVTYGSTTYSRFNATNNPNLKCILVDDVANCNVNWLGVDLASHFVATNAACAALLLANSTFNKNNFSVSPNPMQDILFIENSSNETIESIKLYDVSGNQVLDKMGNINQLDLSILKNGFYFLTVQTAIEKNVIKIIKN